MNFTTVISTSIDSVQRRLIKVLRYGNSDVQEPMLAAPYGVDSNPIKGMKAIYSATASKGDNVIIGFVNVNALAAEGELRFFSTDTNATEKFYAWLKNNGTLELGGNVDNLVRYAKLDQALQQEVIKINVELMKISAAISALGGAYAVQNVSVDISQAKIDEIKTL
jgi:hypothetical protein